MSQGDIPAEVVLEVFARDDGCVATRLGGTAMDCWGRNGIEHVKKDPRMGVRAEPLTERLLTLCEGHREQGMRAGYVWATDAKNRRLCRGYLAVWALFRTVYDPRQWQAYLTTPAPIFNGATALSLIADERSDEVLAALDQLASGAFI